MINEMTKPKTSIWKIVLSMIVMIIMLGLLVFSLIFNFNPSLPNTVSGGNFVVMKSTDMGREVREGSLVLYKNFTAIEDLEAGQLIVFNRQVGDEITQEVKKINSIEIALNGDKYLTVSNVLNQVESYSVTSYSVLGTVTKSLSGMGYFYEIMTNKYAILAYVIILLVLALAPILFAKVDYSKQLAKKQAKKLEQEQKKDIKKREKARKTGEDKLVFYDYRLESMTEKDKELKELATVMDTQKQIKRKRPFVILIIAVLVAILTVYGVMLGFEYGSTKIHIADFQYKDIEQLPEDSDNALKDIKPNAIISYDDIIVNASTLKKGDIIIVRVVENGYTGYAPRFFDSLNTTSDSVGYYTYGLLDSNGNPILDNAIVSSDMVVGVYKSHNNSMGNVYQFLKSTTMFVILCLLALFILLMCIYYKINNRIVYLKPLKDSAKRLLKDAEKTVTVRSVSVTNRHKTFAGVITLLVVLLIVAVSGVSMWFAYDCDFVEVNSSLSTVTPGTYALISNKKTNIKVGDQVLVRDVLTTNLEQANLVASKFVIDISGDYYVLGAKMDTPDYVFDGVNYNQLTVSRDQIYGKSVFTVTNFAKVLERLRQKDMIAIYVGAPLLIILTIILSNMWMYAERKKRGVVQNVLANTFVELNESEYDKRIRRATIQEKLQFTEDHTRIAYNEIKNFVLSYEKMTCKNYKGKERFYCKDRHILTLSVVDNKLIAHTLLQAQKLEGLFDNVMVDKSYEKEELPVSVEISDITAAQNFTKIFDGAILAMRVHKAKKISFENYSKAYYDRGVLTLKVLAEDVSQSIE